MDLSPFISSDPAVRCDGWSPERKTRFLDRLAATGNVRAAAARVGMSRDSAYRLRRRDGLFARGWAAALVQARESSVELLADKATEGIEEEIWYRGEFMGTKRRFDGRLLLAHLARLDRMVDELPPVTARDVTRFDEILACIGGAQVPEHLEAEDEPLPLDRESAIALAEGEAQDAVREAWEECRAQKTTRRLTAEECSAREDEIVDARAAARREAAAQWDTWFQHACDEVDDRLGRPDSRPLPGLPGSPLVAQVSTAANAGVPDAVSFFPRTVSDVSTSALARALARQEPSFAFDRRSPGGFIRTHPTLRELA